MAGGALEIRSDRALTAAAVVDSGSSAGTFSHLREFIALLEEMDPTLYTASTPLLPGGTVGKHVRHCVDFYDGLLRGMRSGRVDYSERRRQPILETRPDRAAARLAEIAARLAQIDEADLDRLLLVRSEDETERAAGGWSHSTARRELQVVLSHAIHHQALIGVILRAAGAAPPDTLGVSPSTLRAWKASAA